MGDTRIRIGLFVLAASGPPQIFYRDPDGAEWPVSSEHAIAVALCELTDGIYFLADAVNGLDRGEGFKVSR